MRDVTLRALDVIRQCEIVAAEDTRITVRLLDHYGIGGKRLLAVHEHNEREAAARLVALLGQGLSVALLSDAGTPGFSDPGARVVRAVREAGYPVVPVPGPNAAAAALSASGFAASQWLFCGFLPARPGERRRALEALCTLPYLLLLYEAPHRILETVDDLVRVFGGEREIVIARELTKRFEEVHACSLAEAPAWLRAEPGRSRGEFVLVVAGAPAAASDTREARRTLEVLLEALPASQAAALAAKLTGRRKHDLYALALALKGARPVDAG